MKSDFFGTILNCVSCSLYKNNKLSTTPFDTISEVFVEAKSQAIFPLVYSALCGECDLSQHQAQYFSIIGNNVRITEEHKKLHKLLSDNNIPYVILKGCASARYYPDPLLRTMGDVDLLVRAKDIEKTAKLLGDNGYCAQTDSDGIHIEFKSIATGITVELHRRINGIPGTQTGDKISSLFDDIFEKSVLEKDEYYRPCDFHHGLILLLHTASHLTSEGIGLRHLCDWAVFAASFSDDEFLQFFQEPLKEVGLWKFAQILTQCVIKHLGCPSKKWVGESDASVIDGIICDIFNSGNFGKKDYSRYQQIKYISNRADNTIDDKSALSRVFYNISSKAKTELSFVKKSPILLPLGCGVIVLKYLWLIIIGKRSLDGTAVINNANSRKSLYNNFDLFKKQ